MKRQTYDLDQTKRREGTFDELSSPLVAWLAAGAVALSVAATILVVAAI